MLLEVVDEKKKEEEKGKEPGQRKGEKKKEKKKRRKEEKTAGFLMEIKSIKCSQLSLLTHLLLSPMAAKLHPKWIFVFCLLYTCMILITLWFFAFLLHDLTAAP